MIESLENNEVVLLMYLADELPLVDRAEVTQMLASDANLREELGQLRFAYDGFTDGLRRLDDSDAPVKGLETTAARRITRLMCERFANRRTVKMPIAKARRLRYPWWAYPSAAAAAILLAFLTWWGNHGGVPAYDDRPIRPPFALIKGPDNVSTPTNDSDMKLAEELENTFKTNNDPDSAMLALRDDAPRLGGLGSDPDE